MSNLSRNPDNQILPAGLTEDDIMTAVAEDNCIGFCLTCGAEALGVEPDHCKMRCTDCGNFTVYGADDILIRIIA